MIHTQPVNNKKEVSRVKADIYFLDTVIDYHGIFLNVNVSYNIACRKDQFRCTNGFCLPLNLLCDGYNDCEDESDEWLECGKAKC